MFHIFGFYKFKKLYSLKNLKRVFQEDLLKNRIKGTIIFSSEGVNGTISGKKESIQKVFKQLKKTCKINAFDSINYSTNDFQPFHKCKTKIKTEVVPIGIRVLSSQNLNNYVDPA